MSQVKKFQAGGSITIGGKRYEATPELIDSLSSFLVKTGAGNQLAGITSALQSGANLTYNPDENRIYGMSGKWVDGDRNDSNDTFNRSLKLLSNFYFTPTPKQKSEIQGDKIFFEYDDNGKYLDNSGSNRRITERLTQVGRHFLDGDNSEYTLSNKFSAGQKEAMKSLYTSNRDNWETYFNDIINRAKQGKDKLDANDIAFLKNFNIMESGDTGVDSSKKAGKWSKADREKAKGFGFSDALLDALEGKAVINDDGSISAAEGVDWGLGDYASQNIYFNPEFYEYADNASAYKPFKNLTLLNGKLYTLGSDYLNKYLNREGGYNEAQRRGDFVGAQQFVRTHWRPSALENPVALEEDAYLPEFSGAGFRFTGLTGLRGLQGEELGDNQIMGYIDLANPDVNPNSPYTNYTYKYALLDPYGNKIRDLNRIDLVEIPGGQAKDLITYRNVPNQSIGSIYKNYHYLDPTGAGKNGPMRVYRSNTNDNDIIIDMEGLDQTVKLPEIVAKTLAKDPQAFTKAMEKATAQDIKNLQDYFKVLADKRWYETGWGTLLKNAFGPLGWATGLISSDVENDQLKGTLKRLFNLSDQEVDNITTFDKFRKSGAAQKYNRPTFRKGGVILHQTGGIAGGSKQARGVSEREFSNPIANPKNAAGIDEIGSKNWTGDDTADMVALVADLGSLVAAFAPGANVASAGIGAAGSLARFKADMGRGTQGAGWNLALNLGMDAATLIPLLGGAAKAGKVVNAVRKSAKTLIKAASVFGLGSAFVNSVNKIASGEKWTPRDVSVIVNGLTAAKGLHQSGGFGKKATKKGDFNEITIKGKTNNGVDLSGKEFKLNKDNLGSDFGNLSADQQKQKIAEVLLAQAKDKSGISTLTQEQLASAIEGSIPTTFSGTEIVIKGTKSPVAKLAGKEIKLTPEEVKSISDKSGAEQKSALEDIIWGKVKTETGNANISKEDALKLVDMSQFSKQGRRKITPGKGWMKRQEKFDLGATQNPGEVKATGNWLHDWWYGVGPTQTIYRAKFNGEMPTAPNKAAFRKEVTRNVKKTIKELVPGEQRYVAGADDSGYIIGPDRIVSKQAVRQIKGKRLNKKAYNEALDAYRRLLEQYRKVSIATPQWINPYTDANYQRNQYQPLPGFAPLYPQYKKGGVVKAVRGLSTKLNIKPFDSIFDETPGANVKSGIGETTNVFTGKKSIDTTPIGIDTNLDSKVTNQFEQTTDAIQKTNPDLYYTRIAKNQFNGASSVDGDVDTDLGDDGVGRNPKGKFTWNEDPSYAGNLAGAIVAGRLAKKQDDAMQALKPRLIPEMQFNANRFIDSGAKQAYDEAAKKRLLVRPRTADPLLYNSMLRTAYNEANDLALQGKLKLSDKFNKHMASEIERRMAVDKINKNIESQNLNTLDKYDLMKVDSTGKLMSTYSNIFNTWNYANMQKLKDSADRRILANAQNETQLDYKDVQLARDKYNSIADKNSKEAKDAYDMYLLKADYYRNRMEGLTRPGIHTIKKGGSTKSMSVKYSRDPFPEILIEDTKASHRFAEKLSVETLRMLSKIKPFHVS